jgi:hypothetical protein
LGQCTQSGGIADAAGVFNHQLETPGKVTAACHFDGIIFKKMGAGLLWLCA